MNCDYLLPPILKRLLSSLSRPVLLPSAIAALLAFGGSDSASIAQAAQLSDSDQRQAELHFEQHIRPVLVEKCIKCHGEHKQEGGLRLDSREGLLTGGESGPAVVAGNSSESLLMQAIRYDGYQMPPTGQLPESVIRHFDHWISGQVVWPAKTATLKPGRSGISDEDRAWWAFQPIAMPPVPEIPDDSWSQNPVDRFILQKLKQEGLQPAGPADRRTLIRRVYFDLIGLPPTPEQIDAFVHNQSPGAWQDLVDSLLNDSRYGEHWARFWLDLVRYAESDGWNKDSFRPDLWRYRDYVIRAFNQDKPYPEFVREQLAGDELGPDQPEALAAVGMLRLGIYEYNQRDARGQWNDIVNEMTDVTADVFLGMGMSCARCHDHKFDPILQSDYFRLRAFFEPVIWRDDIPAATESQKADYQKQLAVWEQATESVRSRIDALIEPYHRKKWKSTADKFPLEIQACFYKPVEERTSWEHQMAYLVSRQFEEEGGGPLSGISKQDKEKHESLLKELAEFDHLKPPPLPTVMTVSDFHGTISPTRIPDVPDAHDISPGILTVLATAEQQQAFQIPDVPNSTGRRLALADWIGRPNNPLTTRVIVNRIWQQHFGRGIVPTASDFGHQGLPPSHPELLDWLTSTFVQQGWSIKQLHRLILTSATWQQSALHPDAARQQAVDPADSLVWRAGVRRLRAEQIRDAMLACSGELQDHPGGPSVTSDVPRRAVYVRFLRNSPDPFLYAFDIANGLQSISERGVTTTPIQSLLMINGDFPLQRAGRMAERLQSRQFSTVQDLLNYASLLAWGRNQTHEEIGTAAEFLGTAADQPADSIDPQTLTDYCHVLLNSSEFLYID